MILGHDSGLHPAAAAHGAGRGGALRAGGGAARAGRGGRLPGVRLGPRRQGPQGEVPAGQGRAQHLGRGHPRGVRLRQGLPALLEGAAGDPRALAGLCARRRHGGPRRLAGGHVPGGVQPAAAQPRHPGLPGAAPAESGGVAGVQDADGEPGEGVWADRGGVLLQRDRRSGSGARDQEAGCPVQALASLNETVQASFDVDQDGGVLARDRRPAVHASMALMRRLLVDAQAKFRRMVEDNKQLAARIDCDIQCAQDGVAALRGELADTSRRLEEHISSSARSGGGVAAGLQFDVVTAPVRESAILDDEEDDEEEEDAGDMVASGGGSEQASSRDCDNKDFLPPSPLAAAAAGCASLDGVMGGARGKSKAVLENNNPATAIRLRMENERLQAEVAELRKLVGSGAALREGDAGEQIRALEMELQHAREALAALKADRKRLKAEKFDLLNQMKQLYGTLEDKEKELRDFIRNYEQMRENEASLQQLSTEREERERERWSLLRHARDEAERSLTLAAQLEVKEQQMQQLQEQLYEARRQLASGGGCLSDQESLASMSISVSRVNGSSGGLTTPTAAAGLPPGHHLLLGGGGGGGGGGGLQPGDRGSCSADSGVRGSSDRESGGATSGGGNLSDSTTDGTSTIAVEGNNADMDAISVVSSIAAPHAYQPTTPKDCSPSLSPLNANTFSKSIDNSVLSRSVEQLSNAPAVGDTEPRRAGKAQQARSSGGSRGGTWGSISRVFARSRHRKAASPSSQEDPGDPYRSWSPLTEEGYAEKLRLLREAASVPMERWRAPTVLAWLEIALGMPQYGPRCAENVKSGKVLLELSDVELEVGLGIAHPMHRKKLRLAIEEHRHPSLVRYPCIAQLGHTWVSSEWLPDLGLAQYSENFATNMVDARMLDHLSKKELEKFLGVTRKFHQASIVHGIHLLRMMKYDRQALAVRRHQCENLDADPLVWTNQRFIRWARNIDLGEYADNLKDSGVHGALVVLEPSFNGDTMATALGIPPSKNIIRRHLSAELEALVLPARAAFEHFARVGSAQTETRRRSDKLVGGGSLGRSFSRSYAGGLSERSAGPPPDPDKERRRASLRRLLSRVTMVSQGSISRALGLKLGPDPGKRRDGRPGSNHVASPSSSSENGSRGSPPPPPPAAAPRRRPAHNHHHHRRAKSIGDIDVATPRTPV
ncbi:kazrin isoform X2 [Bacillus rossius redtenbacheri]|uniref:kazrin isoform X2 n=1 Tax=Bacillus rossius redtenbacheri TaxID=93214 RepID=UPI002FDD9B2E